MSGTLMASAAFALASASAFVAAGFLVAQRRPQGPSRTAGTMFAVWWWALGASTVLTALPLALVAGGVDDVGPFLVLAHLRYAATCVGLWGLMYYLVYLFTGRAGFLWPLAGAYAGVFALLSWLTFVHEPVGLVVGRWSVRFALADPFSPAVAAGTLIVVLGPVLVAALGLLSTYSRVEDAAQRYRVVLVGGSLLLWFSAALVSGIASNARGDGWAVAIRGVGLLAAVAVVLAYRPPAWLARRWNEA